MHSTERPSSCILFPVSEYLNLESVALVCEGCVVQTVTFLQPVTMCQCQYLPLLFCVYVYMDRPVYKKVRNIG